MNKFDTAIRLFIGFPGYQGNPPVDDASYQALFGEDNPWVNKPTWAEVFAEARKIECQHQRAAEYPPMADYLDAVVKGDQAQIDKYIADCLAVKAMYPKPTVE